MRYIVRKGMMRFISYYYTYDLSKTILDLGPVCVKNLFPLSLAMLHVETCVIRLWKAVIKAFISSYIGCIISLFGTNTNKRVWRNISKRTCAYVIYITVNPCAYI